MLNVKEVEDSETLWSSVLSVESLVCGAAVARIVGSCCLKEREEWQLDDDGDII